MDLAALRIFKAVVAYVAAGSGIAVVPRSVIEMTRGAREVIISPLPATIAKARTQFIRGLVSFPNKRDLQVGRPILFLVEASPVDVASAPKQHVVI